MMQNIASQILSDTPSESSAPVTPQSESSEQTTTQTPSQDSDFDSKFGILAKMERKLKEREAQIKAKEPEWEEKGRRLSEHEEFMKLFDENPLEALKKKKGWGVQEFNEFAVKHSTDEDLDPVARITKNFESRIQEIEKSWEEKLSGAIKAKEEELMAKDHERQQIEFKSNLKSFLSENKDSYEFIHAEEGGADAVYDLIVQDVMKQRDSGIPDNELKVMDVKDAAEKVEAFLDKQYSKYLSLKKVKSKLVPDETKGLEAFIKAKSEEPSTLNSSFSPKSRSLNELSEQERKQAAIDFIKAQKN
jgi:hypothetical protein